MLACWLAVLRGGVQQPRVRDHLRAASRGAGARSPRIHPPERDRVSALTLPAIPYACDQARLSAEFGKLMSPEGLTKSIDRHNAMLFRTRLVDFLATVRGFMMVK
eukprot:COSAG06_NODE_351_length_16930_cov_7.238904_15_plen_105_part_00